MSSDRVDLSGFLTSAVIGGNVAAVETTLEAGANANGHPDKPCAPIVLATLARHAGIVKVLLERGADPDRPVIEELTSPVPDRPLAILGKRGLHIAARTGNVEIVCLLLQRSHADPNATDNTGFTPLIATCKNSHVYVEVVRLLLDAGADPALAEEHGQIPLHMVAQRGHTDLVDMLYTASAPATLNRYDAQSRTPLFCACLACQEGVVSKLLSPGAMQWMPPHESKMCPLTVAVIEGFVGVVRVLINEGGINAAGGEMAMPNALHASVCCHQATVLPRLLAVGGGERRSEWANYEFGSRHLLHFGAGYCCPAAVSILSSKRGRTWRHVTRRGVSL